MKYPILYHYTMIDGLLGIISECKLWSSDCRFLNDGSELSYAREIFFNEIIKLDLPPIHGGGYWIPGTSLDDYRMFVTCFCEDGDLLSQWRGYGLEQGYSLGFDFNVWKNIENIEICKVQYGIKDPSRYFSSELENAKRISSHPGVTEEHVSMWILPRFAQVKHPSFSEEREWRFIIQYPKYEIDRKIDLKFRSSQLGPISYIANSIPKECLREIIIGPGAFSTICKDAVSNFIRFYGYDDVRVRISTIPFRK